MTDVQRQQRDRDRFYVQRDKHSSFQRLSQDESAPFRTMKDAWVLAASLGFRAGRRAPLRGGTQHVGFWHYLSIQEDIPLLYAIAIANTGDVLVLGDRAEVIRIAEEYANAGIDLLLESERHDRESSLRALGAMVVETAAALTAKGTVGESEGSGGARNVEQILVAGEGQTVEFKSSARWNVHIGARDKSLEEEILHAIVGFMNSKGGALLIGVDDNARPVGLTGDYGTLGRRPNRDGFETWILDMLEAKVGKVPLASVAVSFPEVDGQEVCRVDVTASPEPVFIDGDPWFHVRFGNSTRRLEAEELIRYRAQRWPNMLQ